MDEIQYYKNVYSKFWADQTKKYGYGKYEQNLVRLISQSKPQRVFEVGIGTGWPIGAALKEKGIEVDGCDVAERSVAQAQKELENEEGIWTGDVLEYADSCLYDVTYCVRASWYIPDFYRIIRKMISMTKKGGYIIFDVMDKKNPYWSQFRFNIREKYYRFLGIEVEQRYGMHLISIGRMKRFLKREKLAYQYWEEWKIMESRDQKNMPKVVFCCRKEK